MGRREASVPAVLFLAVVISASGGSEGLSLPPLEVSPTISVAGPLPMKGEVTPPVQNTLSPRTRVTSPFLEILTPQLLGGKVDPSISPIPASRPSVHHKRYDMPVAAPPMEMAYHSPSKHSPSIHHEIYDLSPTIPPIPHEIPSKDLSPRIPPIPHEGTKSHVSVPPRPFSKPSPNQTLRAPLLAPTSSISFHNHHARKKGRAQSAHSPIPAHYSPPTEHEVSVIPPIHSHSPAFKKSRQRPHSLPPSHQGPFSSTWSPISPKMEEGAHASSPSIMVPSNLMDTSISPIPASRPLVHHKRYDMPVVAPLMEMAYLSPSKHSPSIHHEIYGMPVVAPPKEMFNQLPTSKRHPSKDLSPTIPPIPHEIPFKDLSPRMPPIPHEGTKSHVSVPPRPFSKPSPSQTLRAPLLAPTSSISFHNHHARKKGRAHSPIPAHSSPPTEHEVSVIPPVHSHPPAFKKSRQRPHSLPPSHQGPSSSTWSPISPKMEEGAHAPSPSIMVPSSLRPLHSPSTIRSPPIITRVPVPPPFHSLPPPPPNEDCAALTCSEPLTNTLLGSPCGCIWPMQIGLRLYTAPYTFFPLVSELAQEIAADIFMKQSQVRIMGANPDIQQPDKTVVLIDLVPVGEKFDKTTAFLTYQKFWLKQVAIKANFFGNYDVLYVRYPGLPPSPPMPPSNITMDESPLANNNNGRVIQPLGVDVRKKRREKLGGSLIAVIALSSAIVLVLCIGAAWLLMMKCRHGGHELSSPPLILVPPGKSIGGGGYTVPGTGPSSASLSFSSSIATYAGSAKTFTLGEIERATDNFDDLTILGEGGFGRVYRGILEDGTKVAVKVLKRDDQQGSREFLAEVEMLSRLHHRNLVKLLGICTEENRRCLVYELIPNGSVESHLHGVDKKNSPLDWGARMKIALGSARALAYLHEDSSPRVIHRDFKSSNILLEYDFTPKVSDFGLARSAVEEGNEHISTRVMGTFGYVAPEYAMTGHLLVKSDVYSYGVVLLELLTGRKPVDMSQPPGQENLVTWARPLLTSQEGLEAITDPALGSTFPFDSVAKVAAIASMCVQPEVSQRPFMGEVVQALKLVCNETDGKKDGSGSPSQEIAQDVEARVSSASSQMPETRLFLTADYDSGLQAERALSTSDIFSTSGRFMRQGSESFRRHSSSGPLKTSTKQFLGRSFLRGSMSEHGAARKLWKRVSEGGRRWPS